MYWNIYNYMYGETGMSTPFAHTKLVNRFITTSKVSQRRYMVLRTRVNRGVSLITLCLLPNRIMVSQHLSKLSVKQPSFT